MFYFLFRIFLLLAINSTVINMDYDLKKENRKKFQDKSRLNRRHKTHHGSHNKSKISADHSVDEQTEDVRERQYDETGEPILYSDEELDEVGNIVPKGSTNSFRYKEELVIEGLDKDEEEYLKHIDFKKLSLEKNIDLGGSKKDIKKLHTSDLLKLNILDGEVESSSVISDARHEALSNKPSPLIQQQQPITRTANKENITSKAPPSLKHDEAFLDDLL